MKRVARAFQVSSKIPDEREVCLMVDGERLEPDVAISDYDIGDMDYVDVYIK